MTVTVAPLTRHIRVDHPSAVHAAARAAHHVAAAAGLSGTQIAQASVIASELSSNIGKHANAGAVFVQQSLLGPGIDVLAIDDGPGMTNVEHWLIDGNTTTATLGAGLGAVGRMTTVFRIRSTAGTGTVAAARMLMPGAPVGRAAALGHVRLAREGEDQCGDAVAFAELTDSRTVVLADGLGHGPDAAEAAELAIRVFAKNPDRPLPQQLASMHRALRATRGAAVALARIAPRLLEFCGVGNVSGSTLGSLGGSQVLLSIPGILGFTLPTVQVRRIVLAEGDVVVLHTDGIGSGWQIPAPGGWPAAWSADALSLTGELAYRHRNPRDDAALVALHPERFP